jgi:Zn-dependent protease with chaperone function
LRHSAGIGANAFALPDGTIYMTDDLVKDVRDENEILAVLLHEAGHVARAHSMRLLIENSGISLFFFALTGSADFAGMPVALVTRAYSRNMETEADDFAADRLKEIGLQPNLLAKALEALQKSHKESSEIPAFLASHPLTDDRIKRLNEKSHEKAD